MISRSHLHVHIVCEFLICN